MKSITNLNTLNALIKDENMASKEYLYLAKNCEDNEMRKTLLEMSRDEYRHWNNLINFRKKVKK